MTGVQTCALPISQVLCHLGARVWVQDNKIADQIDGQLLSFFKNSGVGMYLGVEPPLDEIYDFIVVSPGVDPNLPWISRLKDNGKKKQLQNIDPVSIPICLAKGAYLGLDFFNGECYGGCVRFTS